MNHFQTIRKRVTSKWNYKYMHSILTMTGSTVKWKNLHYSHLTVYRKTTEKPRRHFLNTFKHLIYYSHLYSGLTTTGNTIRGKYLHQKNKGNIKLPVVLFWYVCFVWHVYSLTHYCTTLHQTKVYNKTV